MSSTSSAINTNSNSSPVIFTTDGEWFLCDKHTADHSLIARCAQIGEVGTVGPLVGFVCMALVWNKEFWHLWVPEPSFRWRNISGYLAIDSPLSSPVLSTSLFTRNSEGLDGFLYLLTYGMAYSTQWFTSYGTSTKWNYTLFIYIIWYRIYSCFDYWLTIYLQITSFSHRFNFYLTRIYDINFN